MIKKTKEREKAIKLRKQGLSYREILAIIPVSKSSLSLWLRSVNLTKRQKQRLTDKKLAAAKKGGEIIREKRILSTKRIKERAEKQIKKISNRELWLIGIMLYWAEGNKQKEHKVSESVRLGNSNPRIIEIFLIWLFEVIKISQNDISFRICLHETAKNRLPEIEKYWSKITGFPIEDFRKVKINWKKHKINTKRKNTGKDYQGLLEVRVKRSTDLNREIDGWIGGIYKHCRVVQR
ncbi:hypothetical protein KJ786_02425 [Patescibacteria group bacterium]|nr:hypothetical protein [Patescibacteria group bacterium]